MTTYPSKLENLNVVSRDPLNAETPLSAMTKIVTPTDLFYMRNRFTQPRLDAGEWTLTVGGAVREPLQISYSDLFTLPQHSLSATLECAGNGRIAFQPPAEGEPWEYGAVSTAEWTGVPLSALLERAGLDETVIQILGEGADAGTVEGKETPFARSLPLHKALHPATLLAHTMNGSPLPPEHGSPLRLIVPGWYGMASVKWLRRLTALTEPFEGFFQTERYIVPAADGTVQLTGNLVRSLITSPSQGDLVHPGNLRISGLAWAGENSVADVEVSVNGSAWRPARWTSGDIPYTWRRWEIDLAALSPGLAELRSRARDEDGHVQPEESPWNRLGYANNAVQVVKVEVAG